jgi:hypothetical protein
MKDSRGTLFPASQLKLYDYAHDNAHQILSTIRKRFMTFFNILLSTMLSKQGLEEGEGADVGRGGARKSS